MLGNIAARYNYKDKDGTLAFQVVRYDPKDFRQRMLNGPGWKWNVESAKVVPYRLPQLLEAIESGETVFVVEGEKDVDTLAERGLVATCNAMGAGKWRQEHSEFLRGADVVIVPDNDTPGKEHGAQVAASLQGIASRIRVLELPGSPQKGDVSDWLELGRTLEELLELTEACSEYIPQKPKQAAPLQEVTTPSKKIGDLAGWHRRVKAFSEHCPEGEGHTT